jgi:hypothetical protein
MSLSVKYSTIEVASLSLSVLSNILVPIKRSSSGDRLRC